MTRLYSFQLALGLGAVFVARAAEREDTARGFRNKQNIVHAIYFHCGGLDVAPQHEVAARICDKKSVAESL